MSKFDQPAPFQQLPARTPPHPPHTNRVTKAADIRAQTEQEMYNRLQQAQREGGVYNQDIEPEHETEGYCGCAACCYKWAKIERLPVHDMWSHAVKYPGEKTYSDVEAFSGWSNPYRRGVVSPYGPSWSRNSGPWSVQRPNPSDHAQSIYQTIALNNQLNQKAQAAVDAMEPQSLWNDERSRHTGVFASFKSALGIGHHNKFAEEVRSAILLEESGRWPDHQTRAIVATYQAKIGMTATVAELRHRKPIQYLHLLRAGYFEPIPVAWANLNSNPLKFSIEAAGGWRGITPAWRGYEDTAEERLYFVLNHRDGANGSARLKPDFISEMNMATARMQSAVEPPPVYFSAQDTCVVQHTSEGAYSKQVMPRPFQAYDRPENTADDTMILLDVSGSMDFDPVRPVYNQYLIQGYAPSTQPKNKDVAKAIIRRFVDAMSNHDHTNAGYDLITFSSNATHIGSVNHQTLESTWQNVRIGGGTRVMTGWQLVKDLHFRKHSRSATYHPEFGWVAGPQTPMLRLLLLLDGEATDMDEFELDVLALDWCHITIFLIGVDGCPHHHRHANELQRISDVNHHVSFVDAQGNTPERFVTHELLKRHLGYDISMREFEEMEALPAYRAF
ncbi:hypothetical protein BDK51DRAFT_35429 [Blyttiomyces helicus]|uniref:VWFA domain-containing protein n=1 Tax=Blyttiomyces helicus TaxID=388810 RepID=A0A4P9W235_9FUNG|nr:hypothetical protein BDK51DRAFT_35429 [Blyttiomyces helicus]|eukprot:RKO86269.1 hypothetical protein BDK51DRAFT_35429 [Blyttiomyces helicus]